MPDDPRPPPQGGAVASFGGPEGREREEGTPARSTASSTLPDRGEAVAADEREILLPDMEEYVKRQVPDFAREVRRACG